MRTLIPAAVLILSLASCRGDRAETEQPPPPAAAAPATTSAASPSVATASASQFAGVTEENGTVTIAFTENGARGELRGVTRDTGKRKYTLAGGPVLFEVKPNDEGGFKLRTPEGKLLWKVKVTPQKIKISNNEQNENPFELKVREGDRVKVVGPGDRELGNVRYASGRVDVEDAGGKSVFTIGSSKPSGAYGVLLFDGIPDHERYILIAEILSRGR